MGKTTVLKRVRACQRGFAIRIGKHLHGRHSTYGSRRACGMLGSSQGRRRDPRVIGEGRRLAAAVRSTEMLRAVIHFLDFEDFHTLACTVGQFNSTDCAPPCVFCSRV